MLLKTLFKSKTAQNASWIIGCRLAQAFLAFIINMLTARFLGPSNYGVISYAASIIAFVVPVMNLGLSNILVQELTNHPEEEGKIVGTAIVMSFCSAIACIIGVTTYTLIVDKNEITTHSVIILYSLMLVFQALELIQYWFQSKLLSKYMALSTVGAYLFVAGIKIVLLVLKADVYWFALANSIDYLLIAISLIIIYHKLGGQRLAFSSEIGKRMFSSSKHYIVSSLMVTIFAQTDRIMLKFMIDESAVGYYSAAVTCAGTTTFIFAAIIDSFRPSVFQYKKNNDISGYEDSIVLLYSVIIYMALAQSALMTLLAPFIIHIMYGKAYEPAIVALRIVVWYTTFSYMGSVRNVWILAENKQKYLWIINLGGALMNALLNLILIPIIGIYGASVASLITQIFTNVAMNGIVRPLKYNNKLIARGMNPNLITKLIKG